MTTAPHTPQQNVIPERRNRHILEVTRALLHHASLPKNYWSFAVQTSTYLINRIPSLVHSATSPFEVLFHHKPNYRKLRIFGCICFPWLHPYQQGKIKIFVQTMHIHRLFHESKCLSLLRSGNWPSLHFPACKIF
ncbi:retrovirus-related pol polyprotein from transposon tnt 1-94 [Phtheirospermum japonicum]|uniref:Retrovirus-related pol polyprotein from transposon tnt 1-94 n=1 Tax=Phtheirospermum japonicum TaxID=374723 RepID=A0A830D2X8_9LAMI|nr:retrovirus-related pol polyprotein from transposon tnt 1-94 [Phtheirospermum japonicum]